MIFLDSFAADRTMALPPAWSDLSEEHAPGDVDPKIENTEK
jgi:hypothetical protein